MRNRTTFKPGQEHGNAKLTTEQVRQVRRDPRSSTVVGAELGVTMHCIELIRRRYTWQHLPPEPGELTVWPDLRKRRKRSPGPAVEPTAL
jgi:hypothetical protein